MNFGGMVTIFVGGLGKSQKEFITNGIVFIFMGNIAVFFNFERFK